jgi:hypothetical protein
LGVPHIPICPYTPKGAGTQPMAVPSSNKRKKKNIAQAFNVEAKGFFPYSFLLKILIRTLSKGNVEVKEQVYKLSRT